MMHPVMLVHRNVIESIHMQLLDSFQFVFVAKLHVKTIPR